jgi:hypothetical protein
LSAEWVTAANNRPPFVTYNDKPGLLLGT